MDTKRRYEDAMDQAICGVEASGLVALQRAMDKSFALTKAMDKADAAEAERPSPYEQFPVGPDPDAHPTVIAWEAKPLAPSALKKIKLTPHQEKLVASTKFQNLAADLAAKANQVLPLNTPALTGPMNSSDPVKVPSAMARLAKRYAPAPTKKDRRIRSQKALSLNKIATSTFPSPGTVTTGAAKAAFFPLDAGVSSYRGRNMKMFENKLLNGKPVFVRPCPVRPRHGFVDSRPVRSMAEFESIVAETYAADPQAELILMNEIDADWSAIATPNMVTYGPANDGATSGKGSISIPLVGGTSAPKKMIQAIFSGNLYLDELGIKAAPYAEYVHEKRVPQVELVQVRDGPNVAVRDHYVPDDMMVRKIVDCTGHDLMDWETLAKDLGVTGKSKPGVLVIHPGGNMASHYAVHCILNRVSIVTGALSESVKVGDVVKAQGDDVPTLSGMELIDLALEIKAALKGNHLKEFGAADHFGESNSGVLGQLSEFTVAAFHAQGAWDGKEHLLRLRAAAVVGLVRLVLAAGAGEMRHWEKNGPPIRAARLSPPLPCPFDFQKHLVTPANDSWGRDIFRVRSVSRGGGRSVCYAPALFLDTKATEVALHALIRGFFLEWGQSSADENRRSVHEIAGPYIKGKCGYGGPKWGECMTLAYTLLQSLLLFVDTPDADTWKCVCADWNNTTNAAHNGGGILNKFCGGLGFDNLPFYQGTGLVSPLVAQIIGLQGSVK